MHQRQPYTSVGGHTRGSYVVMVDDGDAIVGDLIRGGFASGRIRPGYPLRHFVTEDRRSNRAAVQRVLDRDPSRIFVGHGGPLTATDVRRRLDLITPPDSCPRSWELLPALGHEPRGLFLERKHRVVVRPSNGNGSWLTEIISAAIGRAGRLPDVVSHMKFSSRSLRPGSSGMAILGPAWALTMPS